MSTLLATWISVNATAESQDDWWDARWECRLGIELCVPVTVEALPVIIRGDELLAALKPKLPTVSSLRVVNEGQAIPVQVDERDGTGTYQPHPNHLLDDDDELVFQVDLQADVPKRLWLYFSEQGRPLGHYHTRLLWHRQSLRVGGELTHLVLRNRHLKVSLKGPKTADPMANVLGNFANGACSQVRYRGFDYIHPRSSYTFFVPHHPFAAGPHARSWSLPHVVSDGPVRKIARMDLDDFERRTRDGEVDLECDVSHWYGAWARGGMVDFEESIEVRKAPPRWSLRYQFPLNVQLLDGSEVRFGRAGGMAHETIDAQLAKRIGEAKSYVSVWRSDDDCEPWWAVENQRQGYGMAILAGKLRAKPAKQSEYDSIINGYHHTTQGYVDLHFRDWSGNGVVHQRMQCLAYEINECDCLKAHRQAWLQLADAWIRFGQVETREKQ